MNLGNIKIIGGLIMRHGFEVHVQCDQMFVSKFY